MILTLICVMLVLSQTDAFSSCMFALNKTTCPLSNPSTVFQRYGYTTDTIPSNLDWFNPVLLHEESVLHIVNHLKEFKLAGSGGNARVYQGLMRTTGETVIIKTLTYGGFEELLHEARILAYLWGARRVPRMLGLLASGPGMDNMSMVAEFIENSTSIEDLLLTGVHISSCDWLDIAMQITNALLDIHARHVLFNDLHFNNVLVSWSGSLPHVYIIDFGHATFRKGEGYGGAGASSREQFDFLAPEVWYDVTTPATDIYSLGRIFIEISKLVNHSEFTRIAERSLSNCPENRPRLEDIKERLSWIHQRECMKPKVDILEPDRIHTINSNHEWRHQNIPGLNEELVDIYLPIIPWETLRMVPFEGNFVWLSQSDETQLALAYYGDTRITVVIKMFQNSSFDDIRQEAAANYVMNATGYVPDLFGLTSVGKLLENMGIVQKYVANGQTLDDVMIEVQTMDFEIKLALAMKISDALANFHQKGFIVNNFKADNILIDLTDGYPVIHVIDIGKCSLLDKGHIFDQSVDRLQNAEYISPESKQNVRTSYASDVYSLGVILRHVFLNCDDVRISEVIALCVKDDPTLRPSAHTVAIVLYNELVRRFDEVPGKHQ